MRHAMIPQQSYLSPKPRQLMQCQLHSNAQLREANAKQNACFLSVWWMISHWKSLGLPSIFSWITDNLGEKCYREQPSKQITLILITMSDSSMKSFHTMILPWLFHCQQQLDFLEWFIIHSCFSVNWESRDLHDCITFKSQNLSLSLFFFF